MRICLLKASPQADPCFRLTVQGGRREGRLVGVGGQVGAAVRVEGLGRHTGSCEGSAVQDLLL